MAHMIEALDLNVTALGDARAWHSLDTQHDFASMDAPSIAAVMGLYATAAWRVEQARNQPWSAASCSLVHCVPHTATLSALR